MALTRIQNGGANASTPLSVAQAQSATDTSVGTVSGAILQKAIQAMGDQGVVGSLDASLGAVPSSKKADGSDIKFGEMFLVTVAGDLPAAVINGPAAAVGQVLVALKDSPSADSDWALTDAPDAAVEQLRFVPPSVASGQTAFNLPAVPENAALVTMYVNGTAYRNPTGISVAGSTVTWRNSFRLDSTDDIYIEY